MGKIEQLIDGSVGNNIGIQVNNFSKLRLLPQVDFGEGGMQIGSVHQVEIGGLRISYTGNWYHIVEHGLSGKVNRYLSPYALLLGIL